MKKIKARHIRAAFLSLVLFSACLVAGFFRAGFFLPAVASLVACLRIDKKHLRCPHCAGFINLDRLFFAGRHEYHCACCGKRIGIEK